MILHVIWRGLPRHNKRAWKSWPWNVCGLNSTGRPRLHPYFGQFGRYLVPVAPHWMIWTQPLPPHDSPCAIKARSTGDIP